jgi:hypothetical protein
MHHDKARRLTLLIGCRDLQNRSAAAAASFESIFFFWAVYLIRPANKLKY